MTERFVFHNHPSLGDVGNLIGTPQGGAAFNRIVSEFHSLVDLLQHTQGVGSSTIVHMPDQNNTAFVNLPRREFAYAATIVTAANGYTFS